MGTMRSLSVDLCGLKLKQQNKNEKDCLILSNKIQIDTNHNLMQSEMYTKTIKNELNKEDSVDGWNDILSHSVISRWNAKATPIRSSLRMNKKKKRSIKKVIWGKIECRNYEQRCGVYSCAVPNESGPSLHLGKLVSTNTVQIDEYEQLRECDKSYKEISKKERIERVKEFKPESCEPHKLNEDMAEIKSLQASRNEIGCKCLSVYKMKKQQIIDRILYMDKKRDRKILNKMKKYQVFEILINLQFEKYGRYDVCCIDSDCSCFENGIECQIDSDCCQCGGDVIYYNILNKDKEKKEEKKKINKKDSLSCANPNGNTLNCSVLDFVVDMDNTNLLSECREHGIAKSIQSSFLAFKSPVVQKYIREWNSHYNDNIN